VCVLLLLVVAVAANAKTANPFRRNFLVGGAGSTIDSSGVDFSRGRFFFN